MVIMCRDGQQFGNHDLGIYAREILHLIDLVLIVYCRFSLMRTCLSRPRARQILDLE